MLRLGVEKWHANSQYSKTGIQPHAFTHSGCLFKILTLLRCPFDVRYCTALTSRVLSQQPKGCPLAGGTFAAQGSASHRPSEPCIPQVSSINNTNAYCTGGLWFMVCVLIAGVDPASWCECMLQGCNCWLANSVCSNFWHCYLLAHSLHHWCMQHAWGMRWAVEQQQFSFTVPLCPGHAVGGQPDWLSIQSRLSLSRGPCNLRRCTALTGHVLL